MMSLIPKRCLSILRQSCLYNGNKPVRMWKMQYTQSKQYYQQNENISPSSNNNTVDTKEIAKFSQLSSQWWDTDGPLKTLHHLNPTRVQFIKDRLTPHTKLTPNIIIQSNLADLRHPLKGMKIVDIGCGAGILSESLARLGATVVGVDASKTNIEIATLHSKQDRSIQGRIKYIATSAEELVQMGETFDAVCALEIIEHVSDVPAFLKACSELLRPGGKLFISTVNRTVQSYLLAIVAAEKVLGLVDPGTHEWNKFIQPSEIQNNLSELNMTIEDITGINYNPFTLSSTYTNDTSVNYILSAVKIPHTSANEDLNNDKILIQ